MKQNLLRAPLINTTLVLIVLIAIFYSKIGSVALVVMAALRAVQWLAAMLLGMIVCLAFLFAVFFGAVAMFNPAESSRMYQEFRQTMRAWLLPGMERLGFACSCKNEQPLQLEAVRQDLHAKINAELETIQAQLHTTKELLAIKIERLSGRIDELEAAAAKMADSGRVEVLSSEVQGAVHALAEIQGTVEGMKACVAQNTSQLSELSSEKMPGDLPERVRQLEQRQADMAPLTKELAGMQEELASVREKADKALFAAASVEAAVVQQQEAEQQSKSGRAKKKKGTGH